MMFTHHTLHQGGSRKACSFLLLLRAPHAASFSPSRSPDALLVVWSSSHCGGESSTVLPAGPNEAH